MLKQIIFDLVWQACLCLHIQTAAGILWRSDTLFESGNCAIHWQRIVGRLLKTSYTKITKTTFKYLMWVDCTQSFTHVGLVGKVNKHHFYSLWKLKKLGIFLFCPSTWITTLMEVHGLSSLQDQWKQLMFPELSHGDLWVLRLP